MNQNPTYYPSATAVWRYRPIDQGHRRGWFLLFRDCWNVAEIQFERDAKEICDAGNALHEKGHQAAALVFKWEPQLRRAWEDGFALCRSYGDNWFHWSGEQRERSWKKWVDRNIYGIETELSKATVTRVPVIDDRTRETHEVPLIVNPQAEEIVRDLMAAEFDGQGQRPDAYTDQEIAAHLIGLPPKDPTT